MKRKFFILMLSLMIIISSFSTVSFATLKWNKNETKITWNKDASEYWDKIKNEFDKNGKKAVKDLSDKELKEWKAVAQGKIDNMNSNTSQFSGPTDVKSMQIAEKLIDAVQEETKTRKGDKGDKTEEELLKIKTLRDMNKYLEENPASSLSEKVKKDWNEKIDKLDAREQEKQYTRDLIAGKSVEEAAELKNSSGSKIYQQPTSKDIDKSASETIDGIITDGKSFINQGNIATVAPDDIQNFSKMLYNILTTVAVAVAVIVGGIIGIKLMISSAEEKAEVKQYLIPYVIGCFVVFGAFGIWKLVVTILESVNM